jgi:V-type H+-transporting ATPase subunit d
LNETDLELMKNVLKKAWIEDFYKFCVSQGGGTAEMMGHVLKVRVYGV